MAFPPPPFPIAPVSGEKGGAGRAGRCPPFPAQPQHPGDSLPPPAPPEARFSLFLVNVRRTELLPASATAPRLLCPPTNPSGAGGLGDGGGRAAAPSLLMAVGCIGGEKGGEEMGGNTPTAIPWCVPPPPCPPPGTLCPPSPALHPLPAPRPPPQQRFSSALGTGCSFPCQNPVSPSALGPLAGKPPPPPSPSCPDGAALPPQPRGRGSLTMAGLRGRGRYSILGRAAGRCGKAGAGAVVSLTPRPPPFPAQPAPGPDSAPWAALGKRGSNGKSRRARGPQLSLGNALGPSFRLSLSLSPPRFYSLRLFMFTFSPSYLFLPLDPLKRVPLWLPSFHPQAQR